MFLGRLVISIVRGFHLSAGFAAFCEFPLAIPFRRYVRARGSFYPHFCVKSRSALTSAPPGNTFGVNHRGLSQRQGARDNRAHTYEKCEKGVHACERSQVRAHTQPSSFRVPFLAFVQCHFLCLSFFFFVLHICVISCLTLKISKFGVISATG